MCASVYLGPAVWSAFASDEYGNVIRAKGIVRGEDGWIHFDYVPGEMKTEKSDPARTGIIAIIGTELRYIQEEF